MKLHMLTLAAALVASVAASTTAIAQEKLGLRLDYSIYGTHAPFYLGIDKGFWWVPSSYNEWNVIFWGLFIYLTTLPSMFLAWREPDREEEAELAHA